MTSTSTFTHKGRIVGVAAIALAVMVAAFGAWFHGAGSALAPGNARVTATGGLGGNPGNSANAEYVIAGSQTGGAQTRILAWYSTYVWDSNPPAVGTPCSTSAMAYGMVTSKVITSIGSGNYRACRFA